MDRTRRDLLRWTSFSLAAAWPSAHLLGQAPAAAPQGPPATPQTSFADVRGNGVFKAAGAKSIVAHAKVPELMKSRPNPNGPPPTLPDKTFPDTWRQDLGDEVVSAKFYGPAHTGGDIVVLFEKANVAHMGDLVFNRRQPFIDRPGGASIQGWITLLEQVAKAHGNDTIFVFGHAGEGFKVTGGTADLQHFRNFLTALLDVTRKAKAGGQTREAFLKTTTPVPGFTEFGPLVERVTTAAWDELQ
jgi:glyoxylase-like metal-dependent hydrolase (beta-lactamase superfamily II)